MAVLLIFEFPGGTIEQYETVTRELGMSDPPPGALFHAAGQAEDGLRLVEIWESREANEAFMRDHLEAILRRHNVPRPKVTAFPVHTMFGGAPQ